MRQALTKRPIAFAALGILALGVSLSGCTNGSASNGEAGQNSFQFGPFSGRAANLNRPVITNSTASGMSGGATVMGLTGQISRLEYRETLQNVRASLVAYDTNANGKRSIVISAQGESITPIFTIGSLTSDNTQPSISPDGGKIAFVSNRDGNNEIYVTNILSDKDAVQTRLTNNTFHDIQPAWSPDGTKIAFATNRDGNYEVYVMNADGSSPTRLTNNAKDDLYPTWSPDGKKLAFQTNRDAHWEVYSMNADGTTPTRLTNTTKDSLLPAWSPNGQFIAFATNRDGNSEIYRMNANGSAQVRLTNAATLETSPAWGYDSETIIFASDATGVMDIYSINIVTGGSPEPIAQTASISEGNPKLGPATRRALIVGAGGYTSDKATAFLASYSGDWPSAFLTANNTNFADLLITTPTGVNNTGGVLVFAPEGATTAVTLTDIYWRNLQGEPMTTQKLLPDGVVVNGIIATFSANHGGLLSVLPFTAPSRNTGKPTVTSQNGQMIIKGSFVGAWDAKGKNLAPNGATEVRISETNGAILGAN